MSNGTVFTLTSDLGIIDLLAEVSGIGTFADAHDVSVEIEALGHRLKVYWKLHETIR